MRRGLFAAGLAVAMGWGTLSAQKQYEGIPFPPYEFFEALLGNAEDGNFQALAKSLDYLRPLFEAIRAGPGEDPEAAIRRAAQERSSAGATRAVLRLIFLDMRMNLAAAESAADEAGRKTGVQMAYADYTFLSPVIYRKDKSLDAVLKKTFKALYRSTDRKLIAEKITSMVEQIDGIVKGPEEHAAH